MPPYKSNRCGRKSHEIAAKFKRCIVHIDHKTALDSSFAVAILTEWDEFKPSDWNVNAEKMMQPAMVYDGRNIIDNTSEKTFNLVKVGS